MSCDWGRVLDLLDMYVCMYVLIGSKVPLCCTSTQLSLSCVYYSHHTNPKYNKKSLTGNIIRMYCVC